MQPAEIAQSSWRADYDMGWLVLHGDSFTTVFEFLAADEAVDAEFGLAEVFCEAAEV